MKVSDFVIEFFEQQGVEQVFCVAGGAAAHLMESTRKSKLKVIHNYNEQACAMGADGYARIAKKPALVLVTNGPGSSNTLTGVLGAWQDSIPMVILSGQVPRHQTLSAEPLPLRQLGLQEANIVDMVQHCTKLVVQLTDITVIRQTVQHAWDQATKGRMGPVWLDIPIDVQAENIDVESQQSYVPSLGTPSSLDYKLVAALGTAKRPLIIAGNGIHLSNAEGPFRKLVEKLRFPVLCTWNATDLLEYNHPLYVGSFGLFGERAANIAVQNADLLLVLGSRLSIPCTGYNSKAFAPFAQLIMVDIDENEIKKHTLNVKFPYVGSVSQFIEALSHALSASPLETSTTVSHWATVLSEWKTRFSVYKEPHSRDENFINSYDLVNEIGRALRPDDVVVTDMGTSFTCTMQALRNVGSNRLFTSSALCSMGFGLPGAIGAQLAKMKSRVICISGDGGFQMNIQELQTVVHSKLPLKMLVLNNGGYLAISLMQDSLFNCKRFGADPDSGVSSPNFFAIGKAYGIPSYQLITTKDLAQLGELLSLPGPVLIDINMVRNQLLIPRVMSGRDKVTGQIKSGALESMFPFIEANIEKELEHLM